jgi:cell division septation protein DedD
MSRIATALTVAAVVAAWGMLCDETRAQAAAGGEAASNRAQRSQGETAPATARRKPKAVESKTAAKAVDPESTLEQARKALAAGKAGEAASLAEAVIKAGGKDPRVKARALAMRGTARLKLGRPADAISDLDNALWFKGGLSPADREAALATRAEALRVAGQPDTGSSATVAAPTASPAARPAKPSPAAAEAAPPAAAKPPSAAPVAAPPSPPAPDATTRTAASAAGTGGITGWLSRFFGGSGNTKPAPAATGSLGPMPPDARMAATSSAPPQRAEGAVRDRGAAIPAASARRASAATVATAVDGGGAYRLQLAAVRSRAEATALAERARQQHPDVLKGRRTEVDEAVFGNMGTFYRARIGPFASNIETEAICASLRAKGQDCMVIGQ